MGAPDRLELSIVSPELVELSIVSPEFRRGISKVSLHYIIDGYNLMKQIPFILKKRVFKDRDGFIRFIVEKRLCGSKRNKITIVFDGSEGFFVSKRYSGVEVIFTRGESADEKIRRMIEKSLDKKNIVVISNDRDVKHFAELAGIKTMGADEILAKLKKNKLSFEEKKPRLDTAEAIKITKDLEEIWLKKKKHSGEYRGHNT